MSVKVNIPKMYQHYANGRNVVEVEGKTVGECLNALVTKYPDIESMLFDGKGNLLNMIEVYVNMQSAYPNEMGRLVKRDDEIHLALVLGGG
jgi:sulfur-carrier protein